MWHTLPGRICVPRLLQNVFDVWLLARVLLKAVILRLRVPQWFLVRNLVLYFRFDDFQHRFSSFFPAKRVVNPSQNSYWSKHQQFWSKLLLLGYTIKETLIHSVKTYFEKYFKNSSDLIQKICFPFVKFKQIFMKLKYLKKVYIIKTI